MTLAALEVADDVVVVGSADPVGLSRLARGLVELAEATGRTDPHVVVNRMRPTLGWAEADITAMLRGAASVESISFLPDDRASVDRALVAGRSLVEIGDSSVGRAVTGVVGSLLSRRVQAANSR
jgi:MinD-like ATPase involved in chromosome partitioning or flagellar assembly